MSEGRKSDRFSDISKEGFGKKCFCQKCFWNNSLKFLNRILKKIFWPKIKYRMWDLSLRAMFKDQKEPKMTIVTDNWPINDPLSELLRKMALIKGSSSSS